MAPAPFLQTKKEFIALCEQLIQQRIETATLAMQHAQESANSDDKSSAGDKYETGRTMGQRESEMHAIHLKQHRNDLSLLRTLDPAIVHTHAGLGAAVRCQGFIFFISLGLGAASHALGKVYMLSPQAPLAIALHGKSKGDSFLMNGKTMEILEVF
jgi:hypothetical protein